MSEINLNEFDMQDLERVVTEEARLLIAEIIMAWADLDTGLSYYTLLAFGLETSAGSILIGNMDLKSKADRVKALYDHRGLAGGSASIGRLVKGIQKFSTSRNIVAHRKCVGRMVTEPTRLVFMSAKHVKGRVGQFEMLCVDHSELIASAKFARHAAVNVDKLIGMYPGHGGE